MNSEEDKKLIRKSRKRREIAKVKKEDYPKDLIILYDPTKHKDK